MTTGARDTSGAKAAAVTGTRGGLLLAPGAGAGRNHPTLVALDDALTPLGWIVGRMDFPFRQAGRRSPDRPAVLLSAVRQEAAGVAERSGLKPGRVALGGRSMGGRMCSMAVADGLPAMALVLISYPLHPPGRPERQRTEHFARLGCPCLFVSGTRDAFGSPAELEAATAAIPGAVSYVWLDGGDHGLRRRDPEVVAAVSPWLSGLRSPRR